MLNRKFRRLAHALLQQSQRLPWQSGHQIYIAILKAGPPRSLQGRSSSRTVMNAAAIAQQCIVKGLHAQAETIKACRTQLP